MRKTLLFIILSLTSTIVWGRQWCWEVIETRTDKTPYPITEQAGVAFYCGNSWRGPFAITTRVSNPATSCIDLPETVDTAYCFVTAIDTDGQESDPSNVKGKPIAPPGASFN